MANGCIREATIASKGRLPAAVGLGRGERAACLHGGHGVREEGVAELVRHAKECRVCHEHQGGEGLYCANLQRGRGGRKNSKKQTGWCLVRQVGQSGERGGASL